jgi:hypothetical protein
MWPTRRSEVAAAGLGAFAAGLYVNNEEMTSPVVDLGSTSRSLGALPPGRGPVLAGLNPSSCLSVLGLLEGCPSERMYSSFWPRALP